MSKKVMERPIEKETRAKENIDRGISARNSVFTSIQSEITNSELQKIFAKEGSAEWIWHDENIKILKRQRDTYGNA